MLCPSNELEWSLPPSIIPERAPIVAIVVQPDDAMPRDDSASHNVRWATHGTFSIRACERPRPSSVNAPVLAVLSALAEGERPHKKVRPKGPTKRSTRASSTNTVGTGDKKGKRDSFLDGLVGLREELAELANILSPPPSMELPSRKENLFKSHVSIKVGDMHTKTTNDAHDDDGEDEDDGDTLRIDAEYHYGEEVAKEHFRNSRSPIKHGILSVSLLARPDATEFQLGELSGSIRDILGLTSKTFGYRVKNRLVTRKDGRRVLRVGVVFHGSQLAGPLLCILDAHRPNHLACSLQCSPSLSNTKKRLSGVFQLNGTMPRAPIHHLAVALPANKLVSPEQARTIRQLSATRSFNMDVHVDNLSGVVGAVMSKENPTWEELIAMIHPWLYQMFKDSGEPGKLMYNRVTHLLESIEDISLAVGPHVLQFHLRGCSIFHVLPTWENLISGQ